jgi:hypothetical protein
MSLAGIYGGMLSWEFKNSGTPPTAPCAMTFQVSPDGTLWRDLFTVGGDTVANSSNTGVIEIPRGAAHVRAMAYGPVGNAVNVFAEVSAVTSL